MCVALRGLVRPWSRPASPVQVKKGQHAAPPSDRLDALVVTGLSSISCCNSTSNPAERRRARSGPRFLLDPVLPKLWLTPS
jgi:hypothetical protein